MNALRYADAAAPGLGVTQLKVVELVGADKRVLELGCNAGYMSAAMKANGCAVLGVEVDVEAAGLAGAHCDAVILWDLNDGAPLGAQTEGNGFDVIVAADVLEHLHAPEKLLAELPRVLAPGGYLVASLPNVAHGDVRLALLAGTFPYADLGLLDRTHLRFYTRQSIGELFEGAGWRIVEACRMQAEIGGTEVPWPREDPQFQRIARALREDPDALTYQFVVKAVPA